MVEKAKKLESDGRLGVDGPAFMRQPDAGPGGTPGADRRAFQLSSTCECTPQSPGKTREVVRMGTEVGGYDGGGRAA